VLQDYHEDDAKAPRYYQVNAVNAAIEAIAKGSKRVLLVMATGTGKTYTAFSDHLATLEGRLVQAHSVPRRSWRADGAPLSPKRESERR
jgi:type I site-specific restriction endonuclease